MEQKVDCGLRISEYGFEKKQKRGGVFRKARDAYEADS